MCKSAPDVEYHDFDYHKRGSGTRESSTLPCFKSLAPRDTTISGVQPQISSWSFHADDAERSETMYELGKQRAVYNGILGFMLKRYRSSDAERQCNATFSTIERNLI